MATVRLEAETASVVAKVPQSLTDFIAKWAKDGEHAQEHCVLSILSHGLTQMCVLNVDSHELLRMVMPILEDIAKLAPKGASIVAVDYHQVEVCPGCGRDHQMNAGYVEVESVPDIICYECGCPEEATTMRYVWLEKEGRVRSYCTDHYRAYMVAKHGEDIVMLLEETSLYDNVGMREDTE